MNTFIEIRTQTSKNLDMEEMASFTFDALQKAPESRRENRTIKMVEEFLQEIWDYGTDTILTAHVGGEFAGWLCLWKVSTDMIYIDSWHPIVHPEFNEDEVASALIKRSIEYTKNEGRKRLEVFHMEMTDDMRPRYEKYKKWYESCGMPQGFEWAHMVADLTTLDSGEIFLPPDFSARPLVPVPNDRIYECYYETFMTSGDRRFLEQTEEQKRGNFDVFFDRSERIEEDASLLLYYNERIVGFLIIILIRKGGFINGFGIHPDFRRRGLGKALMLSSMQKAAKNGMKTLILEVDIDNSRALNLYRSVGFKKIHGSVNFIWKAEYEM
ncbi:MAG: GNAT family N-acetyltransferase [Theionarchaea archaeon]|nr:GNAT family N-acetyltransferase [Theionarchaea archaeon]